MELMSIDRIKMENTNYKKILFHFTDEVADKILTKLKEIECNHLSRWEDCCTNHFFYVENCDLQYLNTDVEEEIIYLLDEGFKVVELRG